MLGAFAEREDIGRAGLQGIVDHDAAIDRKAGVLGQRGVRPDAGREHHRVGLDQRAVGEFDAFDGALADDARGAGVEHHMNALALDQRLQQIRGRRIELTLHQPVHQMQQGHRRAGFGEAVGGFQTEQPAADHHDRFPARGQRQQQIDVAAVAEGVHAQEDRRRAR